MNELEQIVDLAECLRQAGGANARLGVLDMQILDVIKKLESYLQKRQITRIASVKLVDGCELGWSQAKNRGAWRFVIRDVDSIVELRYASRGERAEVFITKAMERLLKRLEVLP